MGRGLGVTEKEVKANYDKGIILPGGTRLLILSSINDHIYPLVGGRPDGGGDGVMGTEGESAKVKGRASPTAGGVEASRE